jgi:hypothetical protein
MPCIISSPNKPVPFDPAETNTSDPYWSSVLALLHCEYLPIYEETGKVVVNNGLSVDSTHKFGSNSYLLAEVNDGCTINLSAEDSFGTGDFTVECWVYPTVVPSAGSKAIFDFRPDQSDGAYLFVGLGSDSHIKVVMNGAEVVSSTSAIATNTWTHVAVCRRGGTLRIYLNGVVRGAIVNSSYLDVGVCKLGMSAYRSSSDDYNFKGCLDEVRITKAGRYLNNFYTQATIFYDDPFNNPSLPASEIFIRSSNISGTTTKFNATTNVFTNNSGTPWIAINCTDYIIPLDNRFIVYKPVNSWAIAVRDGPNNYTMYHDLAGLKGIYSNGTQKTSTTYTNSVWYKFIVNRATGIVQWLKSDANKTIAFTNVWTSPVLPWVITSTNDVYLNFQIVYVNILNIY